MNGHVFFSGGGGIEDTAALDQKFFDLIPDNGKVLYIPVALNRDAAGYIDCKAWFTSCVNKHRGNKSIDVVMLLENDNVPDLSNFSAIYIGGGNTYKLLTYLVSKKLDKKLREYINNNGILYGGSAGAIIMGKNIDTVSEENDNDYKLHEGMNLVGGLSIICHYNNKLDEKISNSVSEIGTPIIVLPENAGFVIHPDTTDVVSEAFLFTPKKEKLTNEYLSGVITR